MTTRPLLRSSSSSVGVSAAVSVDSVTISRKWYRKPHSEHHAVRTARRAQHSARCAAGQASAQSTPRRHTCRNPFQPRTRSTLQHAPAASSLTSIIAHCTCTYDQAHKLDTRLGRYYLPGTHHNVPQCTLSDILTLQQGAHLLPRPRCSIQSRRGLHWRSAAPPARALCLECWRAW